MSVFAKLFGGPEDAELHTERVGPHTHLIIEDHSRVATQCKTGTHAGAATTQLAKPRPGNAIIVTDITISAEKRTGGTVVVQFTDGVDTATIFSGFTNDAPITLLKTMR